MIRNVVPVLRAAVLGAAFFGVAIFQTSVLPVAHAQETTADLQGTVKDQTGAAIPGARVTVTTPTLVGSKSLMSDSRGYYHFSNLPPGDYTVTVEAKGFASLKRQHVDLEVGHEPTLDLPMQVGSETTTVEVTSAAPQIDVTSVTTQTNITQDVVNFVPHGLSFQSVIQFAPSASNEPLMGNTSMSMGTGGGSPGSMSNGNAYGFSIAGGSDSENAYLVEGQETANIIGGYSHTSVPFDFIQEEEVKTSGITAQYGGALGGVVNVIMQKGTSNYHGSIFTQFESQAFDAAPSSLSRYDPSASPTTTPWGSTDQPVQYFTPVKPRQSVFFPGFKVGGPLIPTAALRDKIFMFLAFNPEMTRYEITPHYAPGSTGFGNNVNYFSQNTNTYYTNARIDAQVSQNIRVFGSWLYQLQRQYGEDLPSDDSTENYYNASTGCFGATGNCPGSPVPLFAYSHNLGYDAPNTTINTGADITITSHIVSTTRFGYYFENYHDFGFPTTGQTFQFLTTGTSPGVQELQGYQNDAENINYTVRNASKAIQLNEAISWTKSTGFGTHNFVFGYDLNRLSNDIDQHYNNPDVQISANTGYGFGTGYGASQCSASGPATLQYYNASGNTCAGSAGFVTIQDYGSLGKATSYNHSLFAQDSWTLAKGITIDAGLRVEKEYLPGEAQPGPGVVAHPINFGWGDKIAPRVGAAWDVRNNGKYKIFGGYGKFYDIMKLNLAISSFGGQYWQNCVYGITSGTSYTSIDPVTSGTRYCGGPNTNDTTQANFPGGVGAAPAGLNFIEDLNYRTFPTTCSTCSATEEGVAPNLQPYQQHESTFGADWQIAPTLAFEARWDRRRLDRAIEDSSIYNPAIGETFVIVNPGYGVNSTFTGFCDFIAGPANSAACNDNSGGTPPNQTIPAARSYDGVEFRLNKATTHHWAGMLSYTWSYFRGNYTGLTSSDLSDGGGGRNAPNNSRAFDEPYFSYNSMGGSSSGRLPTDRPNKVKGYAYYELKYLHHLTTDLGVFSYIYQGSPETTYVQDIGYVAGGDFPVDVFNRGKWADITQNQATGAITVGNPYTRRTPLYAQSDFNFTQAYHFSEGKSLSFEATFTNLFNEHAVTAVTEQADSNSGYINESQITFLPNPALNQQVWLVDGVPFYASATHAYNVQSVLNQNGVSGGPQTINALYGKPLFWQLPRTIRLQVHLNF